MERRNLTLTLEERVLRWAKVWAAQHDTSVSRLVADMLEERMAREEGYEAAMKAFLRRRPVPLKRDDTYPSRESLHERARLR